MTFPFHSRRPSLVLISLPFLLGFVCGAEVDEGLPPPTTFVYNPFNQTEDLILLGHAGIRYDETGLTLTDRYQFATGRALHSAPVQMKPRGNNRTVSSFSTTFVFSMLHPPLNAGGHGMAFLMTPSSTLSGALPAEYIGLLNYTSNGQYYNHLFAIEFDTARNVEFEDPDDNHVGVDINDLKSVQAKRAGYWDGEDFRVLSLKSGRNIQAWIDYDHVGTTLQVSIAFAGLPRPERPLISLHVDLSTVIQDEMYVGFSAATGNSVEEHYILAWSFTTNGTALPLFVNDDSSESRISKGLIPGVAVASAVLVFLTATGIVM